MPTTNYIWDEDNLLAETDGSNVVQTVYTNEPQEYGNLVSTRLPIAGTPTTVYHHFDGLGSTRQLTNAAGSVTDTMIYDAWGNVISRTGTMPVARLWIGQLGYYIDTETGDIWVRRRPLRPIIARWTTVDPLPRNGVHTYEYGNNTPIVMVDASGLLAIKVLPGGDATMIAPIFGTIGPISGSCSKFRQTLKFELSDDAPCDGYFVQEVTFLRIVRGCYLSWICNICDLEENPIPKVDTYYEILEVGIGDEEGIVPAGKKSTGHVSDDERASNKNIPNTCGKIAVTSVVRFYCATDVTSTTWWKTNSANKWSSFAPSSFDKPDFWDKIPPKEEAGLAVFAIYDCCTKPKLFTTGTITIIPASLIPKPGTKPAAAP